MEIYRYIAKEKQIKIGYGYKNNRQTDDEGLRDIIHEGGNFERVGGEET